MNNILINANEERDNAKRRAVAHELSAEHHRHRGVQLGVAATALSAIVGSAIFVTVTTTLGLGKDTISVPSEGWARLFYIGFGFLSILAPVLTGLQTYLNEPGQAAKHTLSSVGYNRVKRRLDSFISRYEGVDLAGTKQDEALKELGDINEDIEEVHKDSIPLTLRAYENADAQLGLIRT